MSASPQTESPGQGATRAAAWFLLYIAGQVAAFRLTTIVPYSTYPHLVEWGQLGSHRLALVVIAVQTIAVLAALSRRVTWSAGRSVIAGVGALRAAMVMSVIGFSLAIPTASGSRFAFEVILAGWLVLLALGNLAALGASVPAEWLRTAAAWLDQRLTTSGNPEAPRRWDRLVPWVLGACVAVLAGSLAWFTLDGVPHIDDSVAYLFQARTFALGRLSVPAPPDSLSFTIPHLVIRDHAWFAKYFPGWPAFLSLGVLGGAPWLVNPLLGGATIVAAHALIRRVYDRGVANLVTLLLAASPWLLTSSASMMSHPSAVFCGTIALLAIERQRNRRVGWWSLVAGFSLGMLYLVRPPDAAALGIVAALWAWGLWGSRLSTASLATVAVVAIAVAALSLPYNSSLTGDAMMAPHRYWSVANFGPNADRFGFGPDVGIPLWRDHDPLPGHGPIDVLINTNRNAYLLSTELFGWASGSLWLLLVGVLIRRQWRRSDYFMVAIVISIWALHAAYWYPGGPDFGPRFWSLMLIPLAVLSVQGAREFGQRLEQATSGRHGTRTIFALVVVASFSAVVAGIPWRAERKYARYREIGGEVRSVAADARLANALVFVHATDRADYQSAFTFNSPTLNGPGPVFALDAGAMHREAVVRRFPDRPVWILARKPGEVRLSLVLGPLPAGVDPRDALQSLASSPEPAPAPPAAAR